MSKVKLLLRAFLLVLAAYAFVGCAGQQTEKGEVKEDESNTAPSSPPTKQDGGWT